jgi:hypothetical protein
MRPRWLVRLTLPEKDEPYTQHDMDIVIGYPVTLSISLDTGRAGTVPLTGVIVSAEIQLDGSAVVTMDVST